MMIWAILILTAVFTFAATALSASNAEATEAARQSLKRNGLTLTASYLGCFMALMPWLIAACWVVYAIQQADWRFAAIALLPKVASVVIGMAQAKRKPETA